MAYEFPAVSRFTDDLIAAREIADDVGACQCKTGGRGRRYPCVLTDFYSHHQFRQLGAAEIALSYGNGLPEIADNGFLPGSGRKATPFIKFRIGGNMCFGNQTDEPTAVDDSGTVVKRTVPRYRNTHNDQHIQVGGSVNDVPECCFRCVQQCLLEKKVF